MTPESIEVAAWLTLRIVYAWIYLYPAKSLIRDWPTTVETTGLLVSWGTSFFAFISVGGMIISALMILFGVYGQFAAVALCAFNIGGAVIHYRLAAMANETRISDSASADDRTTLDGLASLGWVGHVTSAEKNFVLAAVAVFIALVGTGPYSLVPSAGVLGN